MKRQALTRTTFLVAVYLCASYPSLARPAEAPDTWTSVQSRNFRLIGNASERQIRKVATRLEQFRETFLRLLPMSNFDSSVPLTVIVFKDDDAYRPFEPLYGGQPAGVAGFFQSNPDVDYITLSVDRRHVRSAEALAFHEYVHLLVRNSFGSAPLWFNEGLAEYYSSFEISNGNKRVTLGKPINDRIQTLRARELLPLEELIKVDNGSAHYKEASKRKVFYAQSWALVHYLLGGERRAQLFHYLDLLAGGADISDAFKQAFHGEFAILDNELREYIESNKYPRQAIAFEKRLEYDTFTQSAQLSEAETRFYLGDLLLHTDRLDDAAPLLEKAIELEPGFPSAHASLGVLRMKQNRFDDAKKHLELASRDSQNYLVHYYYAYVLSREGMASDKVVEGSYPAESARLMRTELKEAIRLAPTFAEAYRLLAFINLAANEQLDESIQLLNQAIRLSPRRHEFGLLLAQVYIRREEFDATRRILGPLILHNTNSQVRAQAMALFESAAEREEYLARVRRLNEKAAEDAAKESTPIGPLQPCDAPQPGPHLKKLRFSGEQVCGSLARIECDDTGVILVIDTGERTRRLRNGSLNAIRFVTYTADVKGQVTCGPRTQPTPVLVTYRPSANATYMTEGEVIAVEFIPKEWSANH